MNDDHLIGDDDEFLDALVEDALADDSEEALRFTHAFVNASLLDVLKAIYSGIGDAIPMNAPVFGATTDLEGCKAFLAETNGGTIIWLPQTALLVATILSTKLHHQSVHWISVFESYTCRAYLQFCDGKCVKELLDPIDYWTQNILDGDGLVGRGTRRFDCYDAFKSTLSSYYTPVDERYDFESINCNTAQLKSIRPMVRLDIIHGALGLALTGDWSKQQRRELEHEFGID